MESNLKLSERRIENARKNVAKCLSILERTSQEIKWACEAEQWNDEVAYQVDDAATQLGFALATLSRWDDEDAVQEYEAVQECENENN